MPFYYDVTRETTTNGTTQTLSTHLRVTTAAAVPAGIVGIYGDARHSTAGGGVIYGTRGGAAGSGGTAATANKKHPDNPSAGSSWLNDATAITAGTSPQVQVTVGIAQTGGQGGWVALEMAMAIQMKANAGANGNFEIGSKAIGTSVPINTTVDWWEQP
jgi:hypothetical protein